MHLFLSSHQGKEKHLFTRLYSLEDKQMLTVKWVSYFIGNLKSFDLMTDWLLYVYIVLLQKLGVCGPILINVLTEPLSPISKLHVSQQIPATTYEGMEPSSL